MDILSETTWDVLISGTDIQRSLLSLALSRSKKKILHVDANPYYGGINAALSLEEVDEWAAKHKGTGNDIFQNAQIQKPSTSDDIARLSPSRSYNLTLLPFIIHSNSKLLSKLISSNAYRQLEFQAVGNWWILDSFQGRETLKKIPNCREDIFQDSTIDNRSKRNLMKFLRFVIDYKNQPDLWKSFSEKPLNEFLSAQFSLSVNLQEAIAGLTLTLLTPNLTTVSWALPRIHRHLSSIGVLGSGFGAVISKWGCGAEICQIACRSGAVGGCVYILGTGIEKQNQANENSELLKIKLTNGVVIETRHLAAIPDESIKANSLSISRLISISTSTFNNMIKTNTEGGPMPAVFIVVFPPGSLNDRSEISNQYPVYLMVHSSDTGECPEGQYVIHATTVTSEKSKDILETSLTRLIKDADNSDGNIIYSFYFEFFPSREVTSPHFDSIEQPIDLTFNEHIIDYVEYDWQKVMSCDSESETFMKFDDRDTTSPNDEEEIG
ncbi:putative rab geranylgeranyl transferase escort protein [Erysiphe necator]|uniref:Rab proteins geranylgeranyltransferase n=1 Tax=Uncinula necator TaxID=52586 RepID=A0A0B1P3D9_UNCNE|nr:putative rab geranylgeranyl transferase escort protein [Erysiphe necator]